MCAMVLAVGFLSLRNAPSPQECDLLERLKNIAVGNLENGKLEKRVHRLPESDLLFQELARSKPGDLLPLRNLAITRLLYLGSVTAPKAKTAADVKSAAAVKAREACQLLLDADPESGVAHLLAGKVHASVGAEAQAAAELATAAELAPDDATTWYELYRFRHDARDKTLQEQAPSALGRAYRAAPHNLALQVAWLETQVETKDANIKQTVEAISAAWKHMPGLMAHVAARTNGAIPDPIAWLRQIADAADQADWSSAHRLARRLGFVIKPESWTLSDLRRLERDPLEYVLHDFEYSCPPLAEGPPAAQAKIKLAELNSADQPPAMTDINDFVLADFDLDERLDLIVLRNNTIEVYNNHGSGWKQMLTASLPGDFEKVMVVDLDRDDPDQPGTAAHRQREELREGTGRQAGSTATKATGLASFAKPCHRADLDLVVYGRAGIHFLQNQLNDDKTRSLVAMSQSAAVSEMSDVRAAVAADFYHDGDLDIALVAADGVHLLSNRGNLTFTDISGESQLPDNGSQITSLVAVDWDHDIDLDLLASTSSGGPAGYLENLRHGQFRWRPYADGFEAMTRAKGFVLLGGDALGAWSLAAGGDAGTTLLRTSISRSGVVSSRSNRQVSHVDSDSILHWDFNNDGNVDVLTWNSKTIDFVLGTDNGELTAMPSLFSTTPQSVRVCRAGDLDNDGDEDLAVANASRIILYSNEGGNDLRWLDVELQAGVVDEQTLTFRSDHYGLASIIEVRSGTRVQRRIVESARTHIGLGHDDPDVLRVIWPTGIPQNLVLPEINEIICDEQVLGGSCPYLYTWNGERFEFYTDCLWSAPLGLLLAEGQVAPSREWEYLRIDGDKLKERDGLYALQITEELWEAAYLDEVRLIAVDHPADVEVYSNEKVASAEIARHKVHTVREPRRPVAAHDQQGRDVLERIQSRDGTYVKTFDRRLAFGYTEDHYIELDFGKLARPERMTLFLTGWIRPSGTSVNVAISQNPALKAPAAPSLWVPDADGKWREVRSHMGFPGGKTKTIAVDLSDAFIADDYRLRIATNMEIYWDEAFITVDETAVEVRQIPLDLVDADLHYRGFSRRTPDDEFGPEHYDYDRYSTEAKWPAMRGYFTRYGDVRELLTMNDDLLAVLGAGDELTLRFAVPRPSPPAGWKRDFLLYNVGWDKDCDLNTIYGETVEPLPYGTLSGYPYSADEQIRDSVKYQHYRRTYQTRTQDPFDFWQTN